MTGAIDRAEMEKAFIALGMRAMHGAFFLLMSSSNNSEDTEWLARECDSAVVASRTALANRFQQLQDEGFSLAEILGAMFFEGWLDELADSPARGVRGAEH